MGDPEVLTSQPESPVTTIAPAHRCTDHQTQWVRCRARKWRLYQTRGTPAANSRRASTRAAEGLSRWSSPSAPRPVNTATGIKP
jgi:hypothetical protein